MKLQAIHDLVDYLALAAHGNADQIELTADHGLDRFPIGRVMRGLEHILGVNRGRHVAGERPFERAGQCRPIGTIDQDRLADQGQICGAGAVLIGRADAFGIGGDNAAGQERGHVELLPGFEVDPDHDGDLGIVEQKFSAFTSIPEIGFGYISKAPLYFVRWDEDDADFFSADQLKAA